MCHEVYPLKGLVQGNPKEMIDFKSERPYGGSMKKAIVKRKNIVYYLFRHHDLRGDVREYVTDRRYICKDCASIFVSLIIPNFRHTAALQDFTQADQQLSVIITADDAGTKVLIELGSSQEAVPAPAP
jgi:hypothetical protein